MDDAQRQGRRRLRQWTLVWISDQGGSGFQFQVPSRGRALASIAGTVVVLSMGLGFHLQGAYGLTGDWVPTGAVRPLELADWGSFFHVPSISDRPTARQLRRRAAIAHAMHMGLGSRRTAGRLLAGVVEPKWQNAANKGPERQGNLLWPVADGWYVRGYGSGEGGYHLAVDIMGKRGTPVRAAESGVVGYVGNKVTGYGNLVMLIHPGGWITSYAHNRKNLVVPGERVRRGQVIAELGNTGISRGPHLHFEFMHAGRNCDPLPLFRPGVRHREGHLGEVVTTDWESEQKRPSLVRCAPRRAHPNSQHAAHGQVAPTPKFAAVN